MTHDRWAVVGYAHPRDVWFSSLAQWAMSGSVPVDFVKCVSAAEVRARLNGGRTFSALLIGGGAAGVDRDLIESTSAAATVSIVVGGPDHRDWRELGAVARLDEAFTPTDLLAALSHHATPISALEPTEPAPSTVTEPAWRGSLLAVTGAGGTGSSLAAMALAQTLSAEASNRGLVLLADLALHADQGMLHDAEEVVPGLEELVDAHRSARLATVEIRRLVFEVAGRDYHLLLGLRRHRDWTALRARAFEAALEGLVRSYRLVVADVDPDVEGQAETGSLDIEDRNLMARTVVRRADLVVVVGRAGTKGLHSATGVIRDLAEMGVEVHRILPVITCAPRARRRRAEVTTAMAHLLHDEAMAPLANPAFIPERSDVEEALRDAEGPPPIIGRSLRTAVLRHLDEVGTHHPPHVEPVPIDPGTLGTWSEGAR